ncbi:TPA_asm: hypothetical protein [Sphaeridiorhabdovirus 1]|nr:TPA_asm: hypothetical protein [Sphaeridiorhabdovirus 1]
MSKQPGESTLSAESRKSLTDQADQVLSNSQVTTLFNDEKLSKLPPHPPTKPVLGQNSPPVSTNLKNQESAYTLQRIADHADSVSLLGPRLGSMDADMRLAYDLFLKQTKEELSGERGDPLKVYISGAKAGLQLERAFVDHSLSESLKRQGKIIADEIPEKLATLLSYSSQTCNLLNKLDQRMDQVMTGVENSGKFLPVSVITKVCLEVPVKNYGSLSQYTTQHPGSKILAIIMKNPGPYLNSTPADRQALIRGLEQSQLSS